MLEPKGFRVCELAETGACACTDVGLDYLLQELPIIISQIAACLQFEHAAVEAVLG